MLTNSEGGFEHLVECCKVWALVAYKEAEAVMCVYVPGTLLPQPPLEGHTRVSFPQCS